jgi:hypothetical protein
MKNIFKYIIISINLIPLIISTFLVGSSNEFLESININNASQAASYLPAGVVYTISAKNGLAVSARGIYDGSTSELYAQKLNPNDTKQHFTVRTFDGMQNDYITLVVNNAFSYIAGGNILVVQEDTPSIIGIKPGTVKGTYQLSGINLMSSNEGKPINYKFNEPDNPTKSTSSNDLIFTKVNNVKAKINSSANFPVLNKVYTFGSASGLAMSAKSINKGDNNIYAEVRNDKDPLQQFVLIKHPDFGFYIKLNNKNKVITRLATVVEGGETYSEKLILEDLGSDKFRQSWDNRNGFSKDSFVFGYGDFAFIDIASNVKGSKIQYNTMNNDGSSRTDTFYFKNPNPNPLFKNQNKTVSTTKTNCPSSATTANKPLIPCDQVFTMSTKSDWGLDANNYKTAKNKAGFSYPKNPLDPEQKIKWVNNGGLNSGYLMLDGTDLAFTHKKGKLVLEKFNKANISQVFNVTPGKQPNSLIFLSRPTMQSITIYPTKGQDITLENYTPGNTKQEMIVNKL